MAVVSGRGHVVLPVLADGLRLLEPLEPLGDVLLTVFVVVMCLSVRRSSVGRDG